jgi:hypothetical protein
MNRDAMRQQLEALRATMTHDQWIMLFGITPFEDDLVEHAKDEPQPVSNNQLTATATTGLPSLQNAEASDRSSPPPQSGQVYRRLFHYRLLAASLLRRIADMLDPRGAAPLAPSLSEPGNANGPTLAQILTGSPSLIPS